MRSSARFANPDRRERHGERGQAAIEMALAMPVVVVLLLALVQTALVVRDQIAVIHAAREGARAGAVSRIPVGDAARASAASTPLEISTATSVRGNRVTVVVRYSSPTDVPIIGGFLPSIDLTGEATMQLEP